MRVDEIKTALENVRALLAAGGAAAAERDLAKIVQLIGQSGAADFDEYVGQLRREIEKLSNGGNVDTNEYVRRLKLAGYNESEFKTVLGELAKAGSVKKEHAHAVAKEYGVIRIDDRSKARIIESIEKHFFWLLYQRDAGEMARRATPW